MINNTFVFFDILYLISVKKSDDIAFNYKNANIPKVFVMHLLTQFLAQKDDYFFISGSD
jgi:hypothetical protein